MKKTLASILLLLTLAAVAFGEALSPFAFPFVGRWNPSENPLLLDDYGLQDIQNLRKDGKHFKGVSGHTVVNASSQFNTYPVILNGFHFRKDQPAESHVIVYAADTSTPTVGGLYQNTTAVPGVGNFSSTALYTPTTFNDVWRFSTAPSGNMVASNGDATLIWGGNEIEATSIITSSASITYTVTNSNDYTEQLSNTRTVTGQVATLTAPAALDGSTHLLLHFDGSEGSTVITDSSSNAFPSTATNAYITTASFKFGTGAGLFDGAGDYIITGTTTSFNFLHQVGTTGQWTVDGWVQCGNFSQIHTIISTDEASSANVGVTISINTTRTISVYISRGVGGTNVLDLTTTGTVPNDSNFHHVEVTYNQALASGNCVVYVDGVALSGTGTKSGDAPSVANQTYALRIGGRATAGDNFHAGRIDELRISNTVRHTANFSVPSMPYGSGSNRFLVGFKRPLQGVKFYVQSGNTIESGLDVKEWQGTNGWGNLTITDGTASGGKTFVQTGSVTWTATNAAQVRLINGLSLYWYNFYFSAGQTTLYYVTVDSPIQPIKNIWNGIEGYSVKCLKYDGTTYKDYTDDVSDGISSTYADISSLANTHAVYLGFLEPQQALSLQMLAGSENTNASVLTINYWNGSEWIALAAQNDGTAVGGKTLSKSGVVSFQGATSGAEFKRSLADEFPLYYYQLTISATLSANVKVSEITGMSAPTAISAYKFSETFQNRLFLFNEKSGGKNRAIYSTTNSPDMFNGSDSGEVIFGDKTELTAAAVVYNVFTDSAVEQLLVTKKNETWRISGDTAASWTLKKISSNVGCVAPLTMVAAEVTDTAVDQKRTVAIWVSDRGPVMSAGSSIIPIYDDIKCYWDPNDSRYIPTAMQSKSVAWYDTQNRSYKLLIASGTGSTYLNTELEYSLIYKEWTKIYRENGSGANPLQSGWPVWDTNGIGYTFGGGKDGYVYRLENGNTWNGVANIASYLQTKDLILDNEMPLFRKSSVKYLRTAYKKKAMGNVTITHYGDQTATTPGSGGQSGPAVITNASTTSYNTQSVNLGQFLYHSFKFSTSTNVANGMELTGFGLYFSPDTTMR